MPIGICLQVALQALGANKLRTALTMLGIIIGVGAVITMVAIGKGASSQIEATIHSLGTHVLTITPGNPRFKNVRGIGPGITATLTLEDARTMHLRYADTIAAIAPMVRGVVTVKMEDRTAMTQLTGATPDYARVNNRSLRAGRFLEEQDDKTRARVAILGTSVVEALFGAADSDPIGQNIQINRVSYIVIGVLQSKGASSSGHDLDDVIIVPLGTAMHRILNQEYLSGITIECTSDDVMDETAAQIAQTLRERHHIRTESGAQDDFTLRNQSALLESSRDVAGTMTALLGGIAGVSLLVGGIGIMNIMLVSVQERTREIGVRKAIGAKRRDILLQFLIEAMSIAVVGGLSGVLVGVTAAWLFTWLLNWAVLVTPDSILLSLAVSAGVGLFFGIYPARQAAQLSPIEALRYE